MADGGENHSAELASRTRGPERLGPLSGDRLGRALLVLMVLGVFGDLLIRADGTVASHRIGDVTRYFVFMREFGFGELSRGNLALWNPHVFSGIPFVGVFQSAMFYPPNLVYLLVPVPIGINLEMLFHVLLLGLFTFGWARGRGLSAPAALVSACIAAFGAAVSLRVLAGALSVLATYAWVPLLLRCVDELSRRASLGWTLVAGLATTMMLLAGHPPTVLMSALAVSLYCLPALRTSDRPVRFVACLVGMIVVSTMLAAMQLGAGLEVARESIRESGMPYEFATSYSFPPENLLTLGIPYLFGDATAMTVSYYGRWWYWDDSAFIGVAALALAVVGAVGGAGRLRATALWLAGAFIVLSLGGYSPAYALLYRFVPGFDLLRSPSKFMFFATLFLSLLAGLGVDRLQAERSRVEANRARLPRRVAAALGVVGIALVALGFWTAGADHDGLGRWSPIEALSPLNDRRSFDYPALLRWGEVAADSLRAAGWVCLGLAPLFWISPRRRWGAWGILAACLLELFVFARTNRGGVAADITTAHRAHTAELYEEAGYRRILEWSQATNFAMLTSGSSVWGYDPVMLDRYMTFLARTQGLTPTELDNVGGEHPSRYHPLLRLVRGHYAIGGTQVVIHPDGSMVYGKSKVHEFPGELPRFVLTGRYLLLDDPEAILDTMASDSFDPRTTVVLESVPDPAPAGRPVEGHVEVLEESTDAMVLDVVVDAPAVLVVTDAYARGWRAEALAGSDREGYRVQPADLVLRGIALGAGHHVLRLEYAPAAYRLAKPVTALGLLIAIGTFGWWVRARRRA
ncbi:MAG: hypothetical protein ACE5FL_11195 [Myxococcota bacterium]